MTTHWLPVIWHIVHKALDHHAKHTKSKKHTVDQFWWNFIPIILPVTVNMILMKFDETIVLPHTIIICTIVHTFVSICYITQCTCLECAAGPYRFYIYSPPLNNPVYTAPCITPTLPIPLLSGWKHQCQMFACMTIHFAFWVTKSQSKICPFPFRYRVLKTCQL